jgi:signal peptidase II
VHDLQAARGASLTAAAPTAVASSKTLVAYGIAVAALVVDTVTKAVAVHQLQDRGPVHVVGDLLRFDLARNAGAAFSTGTGQTPVITVVALVAAAVVVWVVRRVRSAGWAWGLGLLLAGILGNLADRLFRSPGPFHGHVVDFIELPHWPVFNVADICINVAALLIVIQAVRGMHLDGTRGSREH